MVKILIPQMNKSEIVNHFKIEGYAQTHHPDEHHPDSNYISWPDLAGCHYSKQTVAWMDENVKFAHKEINPPNVLQTRPIENF